MGRYVSRRGPTSRAKVSSEPKKPSEPTARQKRMDAMGTREERMAGVKKSTGSTPSRAERVKSMGTREERMAKVKASTGRTAAPKAKAKAAPKKAPAKKPAPKKSKFGVGDSQTVEHKGKKMANVTKEQLEKSGLKSLTAYMNKWKKTGKRP